MAITKGTSTTRPITPASDRPSGVAGHAETVRIRGFERFRMLTAYCEGPLEEAKGSRRAWLQNSPDGLFAGIRKPPRMPHMSWVEQARCHQHDPEVFFDTRARAERRAKAICMSCAVRVECLALALQSKAEFGVWGGLTPKERFRLLRQHGSAGGWQSALQAAVSA